MAAKKQPAARGRKKSVRQSPQQRGARCGLCGKTKNLTKTECCGTWICDDEHKYVVFSYARNSCSRNHRRYTLWGYKSRQFGSGGTHSPSGLSNDSTNHNL
jgi:hypothetical protein